MVKIKRKKEEALVSLQNESNLLEKQYLEELESNPKYSLVVDPENKYDMSEKQKLFVKQYIDTKDIATAAYLTGIDIEIAKTYYIAYSSQCEIRRINLAMYQRQFANRLLSLDEIGGYLSSLIVDVNLPSADKLKTADKLKVLQMLIDLNKMKIEAMQNPEVIMSKNIDSQLKNLSIETIKDLLTTTRKNPNNVIYEVTGNEVLSPEENAYLSTLNTDELLNIIESTKQKENKDDK